MDTPVYEYVLHKSDFVAAQRLYLRRNKRAAFSYYFWIWVVPILGLVVALITLTAYVLGQEDLFYMLRPAAALGLWFAVLFPFCRWLQIKRLWKASSETIDGGNPIRFQFDEEMLISGIPNKSEGRFFWGALIYFVEDERIAMLFIHKKKFLYIPKSALPEEAWAQIRSFAPRKK